MLGADARASAIGLEERNPVNPFVGSTPERAPTAFVSFFQDGRSYRVEPA
jgi:hypothetical protein